LRRIGIIAALALLVGGTLSRTETEKIQITGEILSGRQVKILFHVPEGNNRDTIQLYRSTRPIDPTDLNAVRYPITAFHPSPSEVSAGFLDAHTAHNVIYYYVACWSTGGDGVEYSDVISQTTPDEPLPALTEPEILIDKAHYVLEVWDRGELKKSYPVILGRDPVTRKLHQDFRTTPEGLYRIYNLKQNSMFHRALDIDYPNPVDRARYEFLRLRGLVPRGKGIGGEIQIHGQLRNWALERNWTWGCVALRNQDIEELFDFPDLGVGTPVSIVGEQMKREDIGFLKKSRSPDEVRRLQSRLKDLGFYSGELDGVLGRRTRVALGKFQSARLFPVTCALDRRTSEALIGQ
jgi:hypothetical protein